MSGYVYIMSNKSHTIYVGSTVAREKQIKGWTRARKVTLIQSINPRWADLTPRLSDLSFLG